MRSLCGMHTTGNRVTPGGVVVLGAVRMNAETDHIRTSGGPETSRRFQARTVRLPEE